MLFAKASSLSFDRAQMATANPPSAKRCAMAAPSPLPAPTTTHTGGGDDMRKLRKARKGEGEKQVGIYCALKGLKKHANVGRASARSLCARDCSFPSLSKSNHLRVLLRDAASLLKNHLLQCRSLQSNSSNRPPVQHRSSPIGHRAQRVRKVGRKLIGGHLATRSERAGNIPGTAADGRAAHRTRRSQPGAPAAVMLASEDRTVIDESFSRSQRSDAGSCRVARGWLNCVPKHSLHSRGGSGAECTAYSMRH